MAIHWEHIKGANQDNNNDYQLYSFIKFATAYKDTNLALPYLYISKENSTKNKIDLGYFITSKAKEQYIENPFEFKNTLKIYNTLRIGEYFSINPISASGGLNIIQGNISFTTDSKIKINNETKTLSENDSPLYVAGSAYIGGKIYIGESCEAQYFNARSDKRAKENIKSFSGNALDIINNINTYTFNYKNNPNQVSYGVLAQDLLNVNINNFNFINNKEATGVNEDYMSIKESKLIYLLIEAIKEQQQEIKDLKNELKSLKNT